MPFTLAHPAAVLPLKFLPKRWVSLTGLVIGSMAPDFEYFMRMRVKSIYSHTWPGLFWFDLPLGLILMLIYQPFIKNILIDRLPRALNQRFSVYKNQPKTDHPGLYVVVVVMSILVGAASHIAWDGFTHPAGCFVKIIPLLSTHLNMFGYNVHLYHILQHVSSVLGLVVLSYFVFVLPRGIATRVVAITWFWLLIVGITGAVVITRLLTGLAVTDYANILIAAISGLMIGLVSTSLFIYVQHAKN